MTVHISWRDDAACRDADPDLFFPVGTTGPALRHIDEAKRICRACPAQTQCLAWALDHRVTDGVWGGTTADERYAIRRLASRLTIRGMTMATVNSEQSAENMEYVRRLLKQKQPGVFAALESVADLVGRELESPKNAARHQRLLVSLDPPAESMPLASLLAPAPATFGLEPNPGYKKNRMV